MNGLTEKQAAMPRLIKSTMERDGRFPTYFAFMQAMGFTSPNSVTQLLRGLEKKGYLERTSADSGARWNVSN